VEYLFAKEPKTDYLDVALITVMQIHLSEPFGDILVFLTGKEEIDTACQILYEKMKSLGDKVPKLIILIYSVREFQNWHGRPSWNMADTVLTLKARELTIC